MARPGARVGLAALFAIVAALLLGACGGDDETSSEEFRDDEYPLRLQEVTDSFASGFGELSAKAANPTSAEDFRDSVVAIQDRIQETVDELEAITPPEAVAEDHEALIQVFADYRAGYDPIVEALDADDQQALQDAAAEIPQVVEDFQTTYTEIKERLAEAGVVIETTDPGSGVGSPGSATVPAGSAVPAY